MSDYSTKTDLAIVRVADIFDLKIDNVPPDIDINSCYLITLNADNVPIKLLDRYLWWLGNDRDFIYCGTYYPANHYHLGYVAGKWSEYAATVFRTIEEANDELVNLKNLAVLNALARLGE